MCATISAICLVQLISLYDQEYNEDQRLRAAMQYFSPAQLDQLRSVRENISRVSPGTFEQLITNRSTNRCMPLIEELIRVKYNHILPLFTSNKEAVVTILLARQ
jgi:hypothetical protein